MKYIIEYIPKSGIYRGMYCKIHSKLGISKVYLKIYSKGGIHYCNIFDNTLKLSQVIHFLICSILEAC